MTATVLPIDLAAHRDPELSDEALIAALAVRDANALSVLFRRHQTSVYRFLSRLVGHSDPDLDDLVQSTFLEAWRSAPRYQGRATVRAWIFGIGANVARHHHRGRARRNHALTLLSLEPEPLSAPASQEVERKQLLERLARAIADLPHDLRVAFVMCEIEEIAGTEAARVLGVRPGTMWRRVHEARRALRDAMEAHR